MVTLKSGVGEPMSAPVEFAFLHGGGQAGWVWDETIAALRQQMGTGPARAMAFDLPGCGAKRDQDTSVLSVRQVSEHFASDLSASGLRDVILVGHSNAGTIMPLIAALLPGRVRRYVYVSCIAPPPGRSTRALMSERHEFTAAADAATRWRTMFCNDMDEPQATGFLAKLGHDRWPTLAALDETDWRYDHLRGVPASYVLCLRDQALPVEWQETFAARFQVQRRTYIDAGHQVMNTRPHALAEVLRHEL